MSLYEVNWSVHLSGDTPLPPDIKFKVEGEEEEEERNTRNGNNKKKGGRIEKQTGGTNIIPAHKFILAGVSDVFATQFYGNLPV